MTYAGGDDCIRFFAVAHAAAAPPLTTTGYALEIGCAEGDWLTPARVQWPQMQFTGIDWRTTTRPCHVIRGDVLVYPFPPATFDLIVLVSALEHIGLGHYDHDPLHAEGDRVTLEHAWDWLKPGGWLWFDVPFNAGEGTYHVAGSTCRIYDEAAIETRLHTKPWREHWRGFTAKGRPALIDRPSRVFTPDEMNAKQFHIAGCWWQKPSVDPR